MSAFTPFWFSSSPISVPIRCNPNTMFMHHKFCILDSSILLTGSLNWTMQGFGGNWENILITSNLEYISKYSQEFERMWHILRNLFYDPQVNLLN
ncbi:hypothetical protein FF38_06540 [Lucilia cuprina]|uniref:Mitochondrial cardiolipin hydrolase n=1 Tax=Lucilia cuprina TaxID=7375 RepID=A0A0L0C551_LUCCU|nr:hypothetical protein FF38_06540 [Lucilia cuprina]